MPGIKYAEPLVTIGKFPTIPQNILAWLLLLSGFSIIAFARMLGVFFVTKADPGGHAWSYAVEDARNAATDIRFLGAMLFAGGLVERLRGAILASKSEH